MFLCALLSDWRCARRNSQSSSEGINGVFASIRIWPCSNCRQSSKLVSWLGTGYSTGITSISTPSLDVNRSYSPSSYEGEGNGERVGDWIGAAAAGEVYLPRLLTARNAARSKGANSVQHLRDHDGLQALWAIVLAVMVPAGAAAERAILNRVGALAVGADALGLAGSDQGDDGALQGGGQVAGAGIPADVDGAPAKHRCQLLQVRTARQVPEGIPGRSAHLRGDGQIRRHQDCRQAQIFLDRVHQSRIVRRAPLLEGRSGCRVDRDERRVRIDARLAQHRNHVLFRVFGYREGEAHPIRLGAQMTGHIQIVLHHVRALRTRRHRAYQPGSRLPLEMIAQAHGRAGGDGEEGALRQPL